jgi:hypothetical protein
MKIETTRDRVTLTHDEIQAILKDHIIKTTGRIPDGDVHIQSEALSTGTKYSVYAHLKDKP